MTHTNDAQCRPVRLDKYLNQDPRLIFKTRLVFKAGFYSRTYGNLSSVG